MTELVQMYDALRQALAFSCDDLADFNRDIQWEIEHAPPDEALALATIKLEANRSLYWALRRAG